MTGKQSVFHGKGLIIDAARADPAASLANDYFFSRYRLPLVSLVSLVSHPPQFASLVDGYGPTLPVIGSTIPVM